MITTILKLCLIALMPIGASIGIKLLMKYTSLKDTNKLHQQIIIGILFGIISILGTVFGVASTSGAIINIRDAAPICAGLIFGGEAGILAGLIGALYRFFSVYLGWSGAYTQLACSISTFMAGVFTAFIRKYVFDNHHGKWYYGFFLGVLCESFHMLMVFFTHMGDIETAYITVKNCSIPMILVNSLAVMVSLIGVALISHEKLLEFTKPLQVSSIVQRVLLFSLLFAYLVISIFTYLSLQNISETSTTTLLETNVYDLERDVEDQTNREVKKICEDLKDYIDDSIKSNENPYDIIKIIKDDYDLTEISFINKQNIVAYSSTLDYISYDMSSSKQSNEFSCLLGDTEIYIQEHQATSTSKNIDMKYAGIKLSENFQNLAYVQIGYDTTRYHELLDGVIEFSVSNRHVGTDGYLIVTDGTGKILSKYEGLSLEKIDDITSLTLDKKTKVYSSNDGEDIYYYCSSIEGYYVIAYASCYTCDLNTNIAFIAVTLTELFVFISMYYCIYIIIKKYVVNGLQHVSTSLNKISEGDLSLQVKEETSYELNSLSNDINKTVDTLKDFIDRESKKMEEDLKMAKVIQESSLPKNFPAFPDISNVDLYATMKTAKEVGGDFYDFYKVGENKVALLIADVSGKGVPAAMFMMKAKSIIKSYAENGLEVNEVIRLANNKLCEENEAQMFVTAWFAYIDTLTGHVEFANAGHNAPVLKQDGTYNYLKSKPGFVLGGMEGIKYKKNEFDLSAGDILYLYTDGVTEANNTKKELYGDPRLVDFLNKINREAVLNPKDICESVMKDVEKYADGETQSDDITMLCFSFKEKL